MELGRALRTLSRLRPFSLSRDLTTQASKFSLSTASLSYPASKFSSQRHFLSGFGLTPPASFHNYQDAQQSLMFGRFFTSLTDTRYPKRRPMDKNRKKRAVLRPSGPYAFVKYVPGEPISPNNPNQGSVKRRNEKKRIKQHRAFIMSEKKKRKAQLQEAKRRKNIKSVERKMAAVARDRAWAERLTELQRLEAEKKSTA